MTHKPSQIRRLVVDHRSGLISVQRQDGSLHVATLTQRAPQGALELVRSEYDVRERELHLTLPREDRVTVEIGSTGAGDRPVPGRPVVYLDQNHWIALARHRFAPQRQTPEINAAAHAMIGWAEGKAIILPLSAGHAVETSRSDGSYRHHLATMMLSLSRGWQMTNPLKVRADELLQAMRGEDPRASGVISLEPGSLFSSNERTSEAPGDLLPEMREIHRRITHISAIFDVLIENEKDASEQGLELASKWASMHDQIAKQLRADNASKDDVRLISLSAFLSDLQNDVARGGQAAGLSPPEFLTWLQAEVEGALAQMPYLGRLRELLMLRLRNADERWEPNDLIDANYLSCAAGYVDLVVGEKKHVNLLRRVEQRVRGGAALTRTLPEAVAWLGAERGLLPPVAANAHGVGRGPAGS